MRTLVFLHIIHVYAGDIKDVIVMFLCQSGYEDYHVSTCNSGNFIIMIFIALSHFFAYLLDHIHH